MKLELGSIVIVLFLVSVNRFHRKYTFKCLLSQKTVSFFYNNRNGVCLNDLTQNCEIYRLGVCLSLRHRGVDVRNLFFALSLRLTIASLITC